MSRLNVKIEPQFVQSVMRVAMDAVYHDGLESFTAGATVVSNVDGLKSWITGLIDAVSVGMHSGELDPFRTDPRDWLIKNGYLKEMNNGL